LAIDDGKRILAPSSNHQLSIVNHQSERADYEQFHAS
jgi:hypothetical protein